MIVGTDKGWLYLLKYDADRSRGTESPCFSSHGPLRTCEGTLIKIHNRVSAAALDTDGSGLEDLFVGGATYQLGAVTDPNPGGGVYLIRNRGVDKTGLPILEPPLPIDSEGDALPVIGLDSKGRISNSSVILQTVDVNGDGEKELLLSLKEEQFLPRVYLFDRPRATLVFTGTRLPFRFHRHALLDIDDDGELEYVFAGNEQGMGYYCELS